MEASELFVLFGALGVLVEGSRRLARAFGDQDPADVAVITHDLKRLETLVQLAATCLRNGDQLAGPPAQQMHDALGDAALIVHELDAKLNRPRTRLDRLLGKGRWKEDRDLLHEKLMICISRVEVVLNGVSRPPTHSSQPVMSQKSASVMNVRHKTRDTRVGALEERLRTLDWLSDVSSELRQVELAQTRVPGSGKWLLESHSWGEFISDNGENTLWCSGFPGSGKSTLMSLAVENLQLRVKDQPDQVTVYYFFDFRARSSVRDAMASLLRQLCYHKVPLPKNLATKWEAVDKIQRMERDAHTEPESGMSLMEITHDFFSLISRFQRTYVCLDGLDECDGLQDLIWILQRIGASSSCRLLITSRPLPELTRVLQDALRISVEANASDIESYILQYRKRHPELEEIMDLHTVSVVSQKITLAAAGSFLTVILQMEELSQHTTAYELERSLDQLPTDLGGIYRAVLSRIHQQPAKRARLATRVFTWIAYSQRPLTLSELQQAIAIDARGIDGGSDQIQAATDPKRLSPPGLIEDVCMGLVTIDVNRNKALPTHASLTHYFQAFKAELFPKGHKAVARCILSFLQHEIFAEPVHDSNELELLLERAPFSIYAAQHWGTHVREYWHGKVPAVVSAILNRPLDSLAQILHITQTQGPINPQKYPHDFKKAHFTSHFNLPISKAIMADQLREEDSWGRNVLHIVCQNADEDDPDRPDNHAFIPESPVIDSPTVAEYDNPFGTGLISRLDTLAYLLSRGVSVNKQDKKLRTALHYAVIRGSRVMVTMLMASKALAHIQDHALRTPLDYAVESGRIDVVEALLASSQFDESEDWQSSELNSLWIAAANGHKHIVRLLLSVGCNQNKDKAACEAAKNGFLSIVKVLYRNGSDWTFKDENGMAALHHAASSRHVEMASFLIECGADINDSDDQGRTPLWFTAEAGDTSIAELLIESGAMVGIVDSNGHDALYQAIVNNHPDVVRFLANHADGRAMSWGSDHDPSATKKTANFPSGTPNPLQIAANTGLDKMVEVLIERANPDGAGETRRTPLSYAAGNGHHAVVKTLLATHRVNVNAADPEGITPLLYAARGGHSEVSKLLLGEETVNTDSVDRSGRTALSYLAENGDLDAIKLLLQKSTTSLTMTDNEGKTAEEYAASNLHSTVVEVLKNAVDPLYAHDAQRRELRAEVVLERASFTEKETKAGFIASRIKLFLPELSAGSLSMPDKDARTSEQFLALELMLTRTAAQLDFVERISDLLEAEHQHIVDEMLSRLDITLDSLGRKLRSWLRPRKSLPRYLQVLRTAQSTAKVVRIHDELSTVIQDLERWCRVFDPTWFLIMHISNPLIDDSLQRIQDTDYPSSASSVHALAAQQRPSLRTPAIAMADGLRDSLQQKANPGIHVRLPPTDLQTIDIPFSTAKLGTRSGSARKHIIDGVYPDSSTSMSAIVEWEREIRMLAATLRRVDPFVSGLLKCRGFTSSRVEAASHFELIYDIPDGLGLPKSLRQILKERDPMPLNQRFRVAKELAKSVGFLHNFRILHKSLRPEAILIFDIAAAGPYVFPVGFGLAKREDSAELMDIVGSHEQLIYQHPTRGPMPETRYYMQHDIYSLGICLLELGLGTSFIKYEEGPSGKPSVDLGGLRTHFSPGDMANPLELLKLKKVFLEAARKRLPHNMGSRYTDVVVQCITCLDEDSKAFGDIESLRDDDGILVGVRFIEEVLGRLNEISV